jgi:hypothetical protein
MAKKTAKKKAAKPAAKKTAKKPAKAAKKPAKKTAARAPKAKREVPMQQASDPLLHTQVDRHVTPVTPAGTAPEGAIETPGSVFEPGSENLRLPSAGSSVE